MENSSSSLTRLQSSNRIIRLGVMYPPGGAEQEYYQFAEATGEHLRIYLITTRLWGNDQTHVLDSLLKTGNVEMLETAARRLKELKPDAAIWACTSGSFVGGVTLAEAQVKGISACAGCPASSTSLAFVNALNTLGVRRVAVMATYPEEVATRFVTFLNECEIEVCNLICLSEMSGWEASQLPADKLKTLVSEADKPEAEAILIPDTAIPTLPLIEPLEKKMGKPVLTANQVTLWEGLRLAGFHLNMGGWGYLLATEGAG